MPALRLDLSRTSAGILRDGAITPLAATRPPPAVDGLSVGIAITDRPAPHAGERHPDGDELLHLIAGEAVVLIEQPGGEERVALRAGDACVVPRGLWHRVLPQGPITLLYVTPGPSTERRPLAP
jgi:quercetin dioxygenase-like cupin family protein